MSLQASRYGLYIPSSAQASKITPTPAAITKQRNVFFVQNFVYSSVALSSSDQKPYYR